MTGNTTRICNCDPLWINRPYAAFCQNRYNYIAIKLVSCRFRWYSWNFYRAFGCEDTRGPIITNSDSAMQETCYWNVSVYLLRMRCRSSESLFRRYWVEYGLSVVLATCLALSTIVDMTTASCVESKRRYPMATIYVSVYFPYSCSVHPLWQSGALPSRENEEASGPETLREGRVGRVGTFYSGSSKSSYTDIFALVL